MNHTDKDILLRHLTAQYQNVFTERQILDHIETYVMFGFASQVMEWVAPKTSPGGALLDIGSGFGSFVLLCRQRGINAVGIEIEDYDLMFARRRHMEERPADDAEQIYIQGNALALPFSPATFDTVTMWNVLEHVQDAKRSITEAVRVLKPGGSLFIICPNYAAFRMEAHYNVPWIPMFPRRMAALYLRYLGKDPSFFLRHIHYTTHLGILRAIRRAGLELKIDTAKAQYWKNLLAEPHTRLSERRRKTYEILSRIRCTWIFSLVVNFRLLWEKANFCNPLTASTAICVTKRP